MEVSQWFWEPYPGKGAVISAGNRLLYFQVNLENTGDGPQLTAAPVYFGLETNEHKVYMPDAATVLMANYCRSDVALKPGAKTSCWVGYQIPSIEAPRIIHFVEPDVDAKADAKVPLESYPQCTVLEARDPAKDDGDCLNCAKISCSGERAAIDRCDGCHLVDLEGQLLQSCSVLSTKCEACQRDMAKFMYCLAAGFCAKECT